MKKLLFLPLLVFSVFSLQAQTQQADKQSIEEQIDALLHSWNSHNYDDISQYMTEDCDWVNVVGMWWKNRKEVQYAHQVFHNGMFKTVPLKKISVDIRFISAEVAVVHFLQRIGAYTSPSGRVFPEAPNMSLIVMVKQNKKWMITSVENLVVVETAQNSNPVLKMP